MRWVPHAAMRPHRCAAIPFIGNSTAKKGFIDTGQDLRGWDPHVYLSVEAVEQMARMIGWQPQHVAAQHADVSRRRDERVKELEAERDELQRRLEAVDVLKSAGFTQAKRPGRPRKEKVAS